MSNQPSKPEDPRNIAREPADADTCTQDYAEGADERAQFDENARRYYGENGS